MTTEIDAICTRVQAYLAVDFDDEDAEETEDGNALMAALEEAVAVHPGEARLYGLRARMNAMSRYLFDAAADWEQMLALAPQSHDAALQLALLRLRYSDMLAEAVIRRAKEAAAAPSASSGAEDDEDEDDEDEDDNWDEADEASAAALSERYQHESVAALRGVMDARAGDLPCVLALLDELEDMYALSPWIHYTLLLKALTAHPGNAELLVRETRFLVSLASYCATETDDIPAGYLESLAGERYHVITLAKALRAIEACGDGAPDLQTSKADLLLAMEDYAGAAAAYAEVARLFEQEAARADDDTRAYLEDTAATARARAAVCLQGRAALVEDQFAQMRAAIEQLADMRRGADSNPADSGDIESELAEVRMSLGRVDAGMSDEERAVYREKADSVAQQTVGMISYEPIVLDPIAQAQLEGGISPWFAEMRSDLQAAGMRFLAQFDNPSNTRILGMQCQGQVWTDAGGGTAFVAETVHTLRLKRLVTQLSDGTFIMTADDRCRSFWEQGAAIDALSVDADTPMADMVQLHLARVARRLGGEPALRTVAIDSLARLEEVENLAREAKIDFRFREKVTQVEVRGMHVEFHDEFKAMLYDAISEKLAALTRPALA
jgi:hypothetical protein